MRTSIFMIIFAFYLAGCGISNENDKLENLLDSISKDNDELISRNRKNDSLEKLGCEPVEDCHDCLVDWPQRAKLMDFDSAIIQQFKTDLPHLDSKIEDKEKQALLLGIVNATICQFFIQGEQKTTLLLIKQAKHIADSLKISNFYYFDSLQCIYNKPEAREYFKDYYFRRNFEIFPSFKKQKKHLAHAYMGNLLEELYQLFHLQKQTNETLLRIHERKALLVCDLRKGYFDQYFETYKEDFQQLCVLFSRYKDNLDNGDGLDVIIIDGVEVLVSSEPVVTYYDKEMFNEIKGVIARLKAKIISD